MDKPPPPDSAVYGVWADHSTLKRESLGPLFGRISMGLRGPVDALWRESYLAVRADSEAFSRFTLDKTADQLSFTFRSMEAASEIEILVERLDLSIELANLHATAAASVAQTRQKKA